MNIFYIFYQCSFYHDGYLHFTNFLLKNIENNSGNNTEQNMATLRPRNGQKVYKYSVSAND
jgi:hypothetical protein